MKPILMHIMENYMDQVFNKFVFCLGVFFDPWSSIKIERSEITQQMSRQRNIDVLNSYYNKPGIETRREYASEVFKAFSFIQRRCT